MNTFKIPNTQVFEYKVIDEFSYLVNEFGFSKPVILSKKNEYRDRLVYFKDKVAIEISNSWHPSDYGFEVNVYPDRSLLDVPNDSNPNHEMVYYKIKEQQNKSLSFITEGAKSLRNFLIDKGIV